MYIPNFFSIHIMFSHTPRTSPFSSWLISLINGKLTVFFYDGLASKGTRKPNIIFISCTSKETSLKIITYLMIVTDRDYIQSTKFKVYNIYIISHRPISSIELSESTTIDTTFQLASRDNSELKKAWPRSSISLRDG